MTVRAKIKRVPERDVTDEAADILAVGLVAHVGFCQEGKPVVIPFSYQYDKSKPNRLYIHGAHESRTMMHLSTGAPVCIDVTLVDGLVYSRTAKNHTMNFRSVVLFGHGRPITDEVEKDKLFDDMVQRYYGGRTLGKDYEPPPSVELEDTAVVEVLIEEWSAKARRGGPSGSHDADPDADGTAGLIKLREF
ncbi:MAG: pyridoxamine 5'-phosphate oxidase family protein [Dehalococcoidia bacterium]|jgi:hypothetical protein|nr:pyridoxamine 5'-phosphate oxidase family protein [Dehalococcoidia bacterium]